MKKIFFTLVILATMSCVFSNANAQEESSQSRRNHLYARAGFVIPVGNFADVEHGAAANGFSVGLHYRRQFEKKRWSGILSVDFFRNGQNDKVLKILQKQGVYGFEDVYMYNLPIMFGVSYDYPLSENYSVFAEGAIGLNIFWISDATIHKGNQSFTMDYGVAFSSPLRLMVGCRLYRYINVSAGYYYFGSPTIYVETSIPDYNGGFEKCPDMGAFVFQVGVGL